MVKRLVVALAAGAVVLGAVTAFAASMNLSSSSLGAGNATVTSCNGAAQSNVTYSTAWAATGYTVSAVNLNTGSASCANLSYQVTLTDGTGKSVGTTSGVIGADGTNAAGTSNANGGTGADVSAQAIPAASVAGVQVVVTG